MVLWGILSTQNGKGELLNSIHYFYETIMNSKKSESPVGKAWKRLKKNVPSMISLVFILAAVLIAIFAAVFAPDSTPDANDQVLEIANESPGFKKKFLLVHKNRNKREKGFLSEKFVGQDNIYELVPMNDFTIVGDQMVVMAYKGQNYSEEAEPYSLLDIAFPLSITNKKVQEKDGVLYFYDFNNNQKSIGLKELVSKVEKENVVIKQYILGTDNYGRDILSRLIFGLRVSISVGLIAVIISLFIGITIGSVAGFFRGKTDDFLMWFINVVWSIPTILLAMALSFSLGNVIKSFWVIYIAVGLSMWVEVARIVRGQVMAVRELEFVQAAKSMGFSNFRTVFLHILPNIIGPILVITAANFASAILIEAGLSFIGIGVQPPKPSLGIMLSEYRNYLTVPGKAFLALSPGLAIMFLVLIFNIFGNGLRDAFDVKGK